MMRPSGIQEKPPTANSFVVICLAFAVFPAGASHKFGDRCQLGVDKSLAIRREVQATELVIHQVIGEAACLSFWIGDEPKLPAKRLINSSLWEPRDHFRRAASADGRWGPVLSRFHGPIHRRPIWPKAQNEVFSWPPRL